MDYIYKYIIGSLMYFTVMRPNSIGYMESPIQATRKLLYKKGGNEENLDYTNYDYARDMRHG
ncbi:hypothetical protein CR513_24651, partial [Mucuna pruriens]